MYYQGFAISSQDETTYQQGFATSQQETILNTILTKTILKKADYYSSSPPNQF